MRFEIGKGGGLLIGVGLLGLSGAVFCLGLIGGYEIASQDQHSREVAAVYPLPGPPPVQPTPAESAGVSLETVTSHALASSSPTPGARELGALVGHPGLPALQPSPTPGAKRIAAAPPPVSPTRRPARPEHKLASREASAGASDRPRGHQPYSVQIDAVMDRQGAENIARKLSAGGYEPYIVPTEIGGQTWYKVRVGHYETEAEAHAAEQRLRLEYEGALPTH
jgi:septal ring-binding cell division protein DamX